MQKKADKCNIALIQQVFKDSPDGVIPKIRLRLLMGKKDLPWKHLEKTGVLIDFGMGMVKTNGAAVKLYTNPENKERALAWLEKQKQHMVPVTKEKSDVPLPVTTEELSQIPGSPAGDGNGEQGEPEGTRPEELGGDVQPDAEVSRPESGS